MNFNGIDPLAQSQDIPGDAKIGGDLTVGGVIKVSDGTDSAPSYTFSSEFTTGFERSGAGEVSYVSGGAKRVKLSSTGITDLGTLDVQGATTLESTLDIKGVTTMEGDLDISSDTITASEVDADQGQFTNLDFGTFLGGDGTVNNLGAAAINATTLSLTQQPFLSMGSGPFTTPAFTSASTGTLISFTTTTKNVGSGISYVTGTSTFTTTPGTYSFKVQGSLTGPGAGGASLMYIWLRKGSANIAMASFDFQPLTIEYGSTLSVTDVATGTSNYQVLAIGTAATPKTWNYFNIQIEKTSIA